MIWFANSTHSERLHKTFELALNTQESRTESILHAQAMQEDKLRFCVGRIVASRAIFFNWPEGRATICFNKEKSEHSFSLYELNLKISLRLENRAIPTEARGKVKGAYDTAENKRVWTVDITNSGPMLKPPKTSTKDNFILFSLMPLILPYILLAVMPCELLKGWKKTGISEK